jgi:hypothetical protein
VRRSALFVALLALDALVACRGRTESAATPTDASTAPPAAPSTLDSSRQRPPPRLRNRTAYIPPQCYAKTQGANDAARAKPRNSCYVCHTRSDAPNYVNDADLQLRLSLPVPALDDPWTNLFAAPTKPAASDDAVLAYVRRSNYFAADGSIALAHSLDPLPPEWDGNDNGRWDGFTPDAYFAFDDRGFDHRPDGSPTGWRAFAYFPFPGAFFPTNGSFDDTLIRLDPILQQDTDRNFSAAVYVVNLAIVEALMRRTDVAIDPVDERALGVDLDLDGQLGQATHVAFDAARDGSGKTRMHYVGRAREEETRGTLAIAPGLLPLGTELLHTVRYLDVAADGLPVMAARMKEVRYMRKVRWSSYEVARANAVRDAREQDESADGIHDVHWQKELGVYNMRGWLLEGFIEAADGSLRPQTHEETAYCEGCHGGVGGTVDNTFSMARKIGGDAPARGWFHWSQHDLRGIAEPKRDDGRYEYTLYLKETGGGSDLGDNAEVAERFFDDKGEVRDDAVARLHRDVSTLLVPSAQRALDLDRAYLGIVAAQSFDHGRDAALVPSPRVHARAPSGALTGVRVALEQRPLAP